MALRAACLFLVIIGLCAVGFVSADENPGAIALYNGYSKLNDKDLAKGDLKCNKQAFCKVCYTGALPKGPVSFDKFGSSGDQLWAFFSGACDKNKECRGFAFDKANPSCAYLKGTATNDNLTARNGWIAVSMNIHPPAPNQCKGGYCGRKKLLKLLLRL